MHGPLVLWGGGGGQKTCSVAWQTNDRYEEVNAVSLGNTTEENHKSE